MVFTRTPHRWDGYNFQELVIYIEGPRMFMRTNEQSIPVDTSSKELCELHQALKALSECESRLRALVTASSDRCIA